MKGNLHIVVGGICAGVLIGCAVDQTKHARTREVPNADRIKAAAVKYLKTIRTGTPVQDIMPVTSLSHSGEYWVHIWDNTNVPGGFTIIQVSTNFEAVGWMPRQ